MEQRQLIAGCVTQAPESEVESCKATLDDTVAQEKRRDKNIPLACKLFATFFRPPSLLPPLGPLKTPFFSAVFAARPVHFSSVRADVSQAT